MFSADEYSGALAPQPREFNTTHWSVVLAARGESAEAQEALECDVCLAVGTSSVVYPAAGLASQARQRGAWTVEINPEPGAADVDLVIAGKAEEVLDKIDSLIH